MNISKESKMLEQGMIILLLRAATLLIVWTAAFLSISYILGFIIASPFLVRMIAAVAVVFVSMVFSKVVRKLLT